MILTDTMLDAAFKFRFTEAWEILDDSNVFSVKLSDGTLIYCIVMGQGGSHYSLGIYIGEKGFSTYLKSLIANEYSNIASTLSLSSEFDCINCDFMQAKDIESDIKHTIRNFAERHNIKIPRKRGWIDFTRFVAFRGQSNIINEHDAYVAEEALKAATFFINELKSGKSFSDVHLNLSGEYPSLDGGDTIPLITTDGNGCYHISEATTPPFKKYPYIAPTFDNDILTHMVNSLDKSLHVECRFVHFPLFIKNDNEPSTIGVFIMIDKNSHYMYQPLFLMDYPNNPQNLLAKLANSLCTIKACPKQIDVNDEKTFLFIKDFCEKCGIKVHKAKSLPNLDNACTEMVQNVMNIPF